MTRLSPGHKVPAGVATPAYDPENHGVGIVHLGVGAFHRAHQAVYTDDALAAQDGADSGGDWRIAGVSLRSTAIADALNAQGGRYTLLTRGVEGSQARIIASIASVIAAAQTPAAVFDALAQPATRIVSLTVTEKAYGIDRASGGIDPAHAAIAGDLKNPRQPAGAIGVLVEGLRRRHAAGTDPFTVLSCDNLPGNGALLRGGVIDFAGRADPVLADWIAANVAFPSTMVDRITPAATPQLAAEVAATIGADDAAAVATEQFSQWVIEDTFTAGHPAWQAGGALFVDDVTPFEDMKLRMLNGAHSLIAYAGYLAGCKHVRDAMALDPLRRLVRRHFAAAAATLEPIPGFDFVTYAGDLDARFCNPAIAHETYQIAMDGTEKLPQRILVPAVAALAAGQDAAPFAFAIAAWMRYCLGRNDAGAAYDLRDPRSAEIATVLAGRQNAVAIADALFTLPGLFPAVLVHNQPWRNLVHDQLATMLEHSVAAAIDKAARDT